MTQPFLPYGRQVIDDDDIAAVTAVLKGDWLTTGPAVAAFEQALANRVGARYAVACSSGTAALHLAALALGLGPGDAMVVPAITFLATANAARYVGADVVFADVDPDTGLMTPETLNAALKRAAGRNVRAIAPVHFAGQCEDLAAFRKIADDHGLDIVEDACHALGAVYQTANRAPAPVGGCQFGNMAVFSFHPVKTVAMGEGGAVTTNDDSLFERLTTLRNHGMIRNPERLAHRADAFDDSGKLNPWYYEMTEPGFNYRASDIHCALGLSQIARLDHFIACRRELTGRYDERLESLAPSVRPLARTAGCRPGWHLYVALIDFTTLGLDRAEVMIKLRDKGIGTQVHYYPVNRQPYYRELYGDAALPGADAYYNRALSLPLFAGMDIADVDRVVDTFGQVLGL
ncbi:MAG: UDP-4-amino-4,6-dideoxy-N-acetyl-beta-L-altrosamine transaminase [Sphingomonadales bacterium]